MTQPRLLPPGSTIGILGGGQLGRMTALAAANLGYKTHIFDPADSGPALQVTPLHTRADFNDTAALERFAKAVDVVTLEWENVPTTALDVLARSVPVHPGSGVLQVTQDRLAEKSFARQHGVGTADFQAVRSAAELETAVAALGGSAILKSTRMGYDGKGQVRIRPGDDLATAWRNMGSDAGIAEQILPFAHEISVIAARRADGDMALYPAVRNIHVNGILAETHAPAQMDAAILAEAARQARVLTESLGVVGLLAVELFVMPDGRVLMNEMAPRPHNSGHWTMDGCVTSQFEQLVRAICGLPLGSTQPIGASVMYNLIGDQAEKWRDLLAEPNMHLHLYGKDESRAGRKMGHATRVTLP
jgi:5-(carboxyamino)imidazole ribonucleotide synthase